VSRELTAFGMRADMKRRRWCAPISSSEHCSCTPEAMLVNKGGEEIKGRGSRRRKEKQEGRGSRGRGSRKERGLMEKGEL